MKTKRLALLALYVSVAVVLLHTVGIAANRCCQDAQPHASCKDCILFWEFPDQYLDVGTNAINKCAPTQQTSACDEVNYKCYKLTNAQLFSDSGCSVPVATATVIFEVPQCAANDDMCQGG